MTSNTVVVIRDIVQMRYWHLNSNLPNSQEEAEAAFASFAIHANFRSTYITKQWKQVSADMHNTLCDATGCYKIVILHATLRNPLTRKCSKSVIVLMVTTVLSVAKGDGGA